MAYFSLDEIKLLLHKDIANTLLDAELKSQGVQADDYIDSMLGAFTTTPIAQAPDQLKRLSNKLAAAYYIYWNSPSHEMDGVNSIKKEIEQYIRVTYGKRTETMTTNTWGKTPSGITGTEG